MTLADILQAVLLGVAIGVLASVPVAMVIAISTTPRSVRWEHDTYRADVTIATPTRAVVIYDPEILEVL